MSDRRLEQNHVVAARKRRLGLMQRGGKVIVVLDEPPTGEERARRSTHHMSGYESRLQRRVHLRQLRLVDFQVEPLRALQRGQQLGLGEVIPARWNGAEHDAMLREPCDNLCPRRSAAMMVISGESGQCATRAAGL